MKYSINCGYCDKEVVVAADDDEEGMKRMKEEAESHNKLRHPEERPMSEEELEKDIRSKWKKE